MKKTNYEIPEMTMVEFAPSDIIRTSPASDENQGEWDAV